METKDALIQWINEGLSKDRGTTVSGLARALGIPSSRVSEMRSGKMAIAIDELVPIARYLQRPIPSSILGPMVEVSAWAESKNKPASQADKSNIALDKRYKVHRPANRQRFVTHLNIDDLEKMAEAEANIEDIIRMSMKSFAKD